MHKKIALFFLLSFWSCTFFTEKSSAQKIIDQAIAAYGGKAWEHINLEFKFRNHNYSLNRKQNNFIYVRTALAPRTSYVDSLRSTGTFTRHQNGSLVQLNDSLKKVYSASVNSVLYFVQLPYVLNDAAVIKEQLPDQYIKGKKYHRIKITFQQQGGGKDYEDEFRYWIAPKTFTVDYMAYKYFTDGGGTRFRVAYNKRQVGPIQVQDYRNLKPQEKFPPLDSLPKLFEQQQLKQLSVIENTNWKIKN